MRVRALTTLGFRNLADAEIAFGERITLAWGENGAGKSNLLEALYFGLSGRSCRTSRDREAIGFERPLARVEVEVEEGTERRQFLCSVARDGERRHLVDGSEAGAEATRMRPALAVFLPDRLALVKGPPATRRAHLDRYCSARWPARADLRRRYGQALAQRNALLGRVRAGLAAEGSLDAWDRELALLGVELTAIRAEAAEALAPAFATAATELGLDQEATLRYRPRVEDGDPEALIVELGRRRPSDLARGFSGHGPHLDEIELEAGGRALRRYGSQGQQRTALLALLFAERESLLEARLPPPLMLLDDVMSELDLSRRRLLGERLQAGGGQALLTATEPDQLPAELERTELPMREGRVIGPLEGSVDEVEAA